VTILVGYAPRPEGLRALEVGAQEARLRGEHLHVATFLTHEVGESPTAAKRDMDSAQATERHLERVREELAKEGLEVTTDLLHGQMGEAGRMLLEEARSVGAQLIVIGMRRRTAVGKLVLGSVAQDVLLGADCPVMAVKAHREAEDA
jgi:nucleotide-binding universal stress UspA family protein